MSKSRTFELKLFPVPECKWTADAARQWLREGREGFEEILREGFAKGKTDAILDPLWAHWHLSGDVATMTAAALAVIEDGVRVTFERRFPESHVDALGDLVRVLLHHAAIMTEEARGLDATEWPALTALTAVATERLAALESKPEAEGAATLDGYVRSMRAEEVSA